MQALDDIEWVKDRETFGLPPIVLPRLVVLSLTDKPQDPILEAIKREATPFNILQHQPEPHSKHEESNIQQGKNDGTLWIGAAKDDVRNKCQIMSWDALRQGRVLQHRGTPFSSEQQDFALAAARYHVLPHLQQPDVHVLDVSSVQLFASLKMTMLGAASVLYAWDATMERFIQAPAKDGYRLLILVDRKDELVCASFIQRFTLIGTLFRRLEILIAGIRKRPAHEGPTIHAFAHALSTLLAYIQEELALPSNDLQSACSMPFASIWIRYQPYEEILIAWSRLCYRDPDRLPSNYVTLDSSPPWLLSHIYDHLNSHIEEHSPRIIVASFAYILESSSRDYLRRVCHSVGIGQASIPQQDTISYHSEEHVDEAERYPTFFPVQLSASLPTSKKSLRLLQAAQADCQTFVDGATRGVEWMWTEEDIGNLWSNKNCQAEQPHNRIASIDGNTDFETKSGYQSADFRVFDLEPGTHLVHPSKNGLAASSTYDLRRCLATFPDSLPAITPTLQLLTSLIFAPLVTHAARLSSNLLSIFLSHSSILHFHTHLVLLRSYLLLTSHSFKSRLTAALFSDAADAESDGHSVIDPARVTPSGLSVDYCDTEARPWAVGLAPSLIKRETWPPGGADLSFLLRTVIVDSLEIDRDAVDALSSIQMASRSVRSAIFEEAEYRLGFAIRDLPTGPGRDRWLNPLSIEALDFLYLDFKPPDPLSVLITPEILSKYHRLFAFLLRLLRVENVVCAVYRMTRKQSKPLFPTLMSSNALLLHFQFIARSFVSSLTGYVFDTVIGGKFDRFLESLTPDDHAYSDIFSLAMAHSAVLDDVLFACLLRSGQRGVGDLLRGALAIVLEFGILAGELRMGRLAEYQAAPLLQVHFSDFRDKIITLTKVLKALGEKDSLSSGVLDHGSDGAPRSGSSRGTDVLHHLLIRLDFGDWWSRLQT